MHSFVELVDRGAAFTLDALKQANEKALDGLQTSAATPSVKTLQMVKLQKAISAVGMFSIFEAILQDALKCADGFSRGGEASRAGRRDGLKGPFCRFPNCN